VWTGRGRGSGSGTQPIAGGGGVGSVRAIQTDGISLEKDITCKRHMRDMNARNVKRREFNCGAKMAKYLKNKITHRKTSKCLAGRLITVDNANTTLTTRVVIIEPEGVVHVLYDYRDGQERTGGARLGVSEARIEAIDGDICLMCGDTGVIKNRLGCRVISGRDCGADQRMTTDGHERSLQMNLTISPRSATTL
jgi:hypothetical protein